MPQVRNPCLECPIHLEGCDKQNHVDCVKCPARVEYLVYLSRPESALSVHGRSRPQFNRLREVNTKRPKSYSEWTSEELSFLRSNYGRLSNLEIAKHLNRSVGSIDRIAYNRGFKRQRWRGLPKFYR